MNPTTFWTAYIAVVIACVAVIALPRLARWFVRRDLARFITNRK